MTHVVHNLGTSRSAAQFLDQRLRYPGLDFIHCFGLVGAAVSKLCDAIAVTDATVGGGQFSIRHLTEGAQRSGQLRVDQRSTCGGIGNTTIACFVIRDGRVGGCTTCW